MSRLDMPISEHRKIRRSRDVQAALTAIAERVAAEAGSAADTPGGYSTDIKTYTDRARAHVWPKSFAAIRAENKDAHLMGIAGREGAK
jgi:hypothetical protein